MSVELVTGHAGSPHVTSEQASEFNKGCFGKDNYILATRQRCECTVMNANSVRISSGDVLASGRHIAVSTPEVLKIKNGSQGMKRNDLIGVRYTKNSAGVERVTIEVLTGSPSATSPRDPYYSESEITNNTTNTFIPLYRIRIDGITVKEPEAVAKRLKTMREDIIDTVYPIGAVYISFNSTNPATMFGGTWEQLEDRFLFASRGSGTLGGEKEHTLTEAEMPSHRHGIMQHNYNGDYESWVVPYPKELVAAYSGYMCDYSGGDKPHNNMPPYITCYMWRRIG